MEYMELIFSIENFQKEREHYPNQLVYVGLKNAMHGDII